MLKMWQTRLYDYMIPPLGSIKIDKKITPCNILFFRNNSDTHQIYINISKKWYWSSEIPDVILPQTVPHVLGIVSLEFTNVTLLPIWYKPFIQHVLNGSSFYALLFCVNAPGSNNILQ